jgi:hypothetical protein
VGPSTGSSSTSTAGSPTARSTSSPRCTTATSRAARS